MNAEALKTESPNAPTLAADSQAYLFSFNVTPGATILAPPVVQPFGPASLTALVTTLAAGLQLDLLQEEFPPEITFEFSPLSPMVWHDPCGVTIAQPAWVADLVVTETQITFTVNNPAGTTDPKGLTQPIVAGFTPKIVRVFGLERMEFEAPDPTIVNIDPTGG